MPKKTRKYNTRAQIYSGITFLETELRNIDKAIQAQKLRGWKNAGHAHNAQYKRNVKYRRALINVLKRIQEDLDFQC